MRKLSDFEKIKEWGVNQYKNPGVQTLIAILNMASHGSVGLINKAIELKINEYTEKKLRILFDKIETGEIVLNEELIESDSFLHSFFSTVNAVIRTRSKEKIYLFAQAFINYSKSNIHKYADEYEEMINILLELTELEMYILTTLNKFEAGVTGYVDQFPNEKIDSNNFWEQFTKVIAEKISQEEIAPRLIRLQRTGLYQSFGATTFDQLGDITPGSEAGYLTPMYYKLKSWVLSEVNL